MGAACAPGAKLGPAYLFFGCRKADHDYIYADELVEYVRSGALTKLWVAFSRAGAEKEYVQHQLQREGTLVAPVLSKAGPGHFYVCGDAKNMAKVRRPQRCMPSWPAWKHLPRLSAICASARCVWRSWYHV